MTQPRSAHELRPARAKVAVPSRRRRVGPSKSPTRTFASTLREQRARHAEARRAPADLREPQEPTATRRGAHEEAERELPRERERPHRPRTLEPVPEDGVLHLPPPVILTPPSAAQAPAGASPAWERAEAAALAEQVLHHVRVGSDGEVRLGLGGIFAGAEVRLRLEGGRIVPTLVTDDPAAVTGLVERLQRELAARGLGADPVSVELP